MPKDVVHQSISNYTSGIKCAVFEETIRKTTRKSRRGGAIWAAYSGVGGNQCLRCICSAPLPTSKTHLRSAQILLDFSRIHRLLEEVSFALEGRHLACHCNSSLPSPQPQQGLDQHCCLLFLYSTTAEIVLW